MYDSFKFTCQLLLEDFTGTELFQIGSYVYLKTAFKIHTDKFSRSQKHFHVVKYFGIKSI